MDRLDENEVMRRLEEYRPASGIDEEWTPAARAGALRTAFDAGQAPRISYTASTRLRRRWPAVIGGIAAAAVAAALIEVVPHGSSSSPGSGGTDTAAPRSTAISTAVSPTPPPEGPVQRLADTARHTSLGNPGAGQYWYQRRELYAPDHPGPNSEHIGSTINYVAPTGTSTSTVTARRARTTNSSGRRTRTIPTPPTSTACRLIRPRCTTICVHTSAAPAPSRRRSSLPSETRCTTPKAWSARTCAPHSSRCSLASRQ
jgi:hypothetical protein